MYAFYKNVGNIPRLYRLVDFSNKIAALFILRAGRFGAFVAAQRLLRVARRPLRMTWRDSQQNRPARSIIRFL